MSDDEDRKRHEHEEHKEHEGRGLFGDLRDAARAVGRVVDDIEDRIERAVKDVVHGHDDDDDGGGHGGHGGHGGSSGPPPYRPQPDPGVDDHGLDGRPINPKEPAPQRGPRHWPGPRKDAENPFLFLRAVQGDTGARPVAGVFWESPDIFLLGGVKPSVAPEVPSALGETAVAGADNTVYAHVWNLGREATRELVVEFWWCNPALGIDAGSAQLIGRERGWLGNRYSGRSHAVVKCQSSWRATFANGGHECLVVRAYDLAKDRLHGPEWDARQNRQVAQRNVHVIAGPGSGTDGLTLDVGQLFGHPADLTMTRHVPTDMPWLQLHTGTRGLFPVGAAPTGELSIGRLGTAGTHGGLTVAGDGTQVTIASTDTAPAPGQAHVYRVAAAQDGWTFGGYTVVVTG